MAQKLISKSDFARVCGCSPATVTRAARTTLAAARASADALRAMSRESIGVRALQDVHALSAQSEEESGSSPGDSSVGR